MNEEAGATSGGAPLNIRILSLTKEKIEFELYGEGVDSSLANSLRRMMIAEVPTLAIDTAEIYENSSPLHDEFLSHRLGLIPLDSRLVNRFRYPQECSCQGECPNCAVSLIIDASHETSANEVDMGIAGAKPVPVTSLNVVPAPNQPFPIRPVHIGDDDMGVGGEAAGGGSSNVRRMPIVITQLGRNQRVRVRCVARKGMGKEHAKWNPTAGCTYKYKPVLSLDQELIQQLSVGKQKQLQQVCPVRVFDYDDETEQLVIARPQDCMFCKACTKMATESFDMEDLLSVEMDQHCFRFSVETTGVLPPEVIVLNAIELLSNKVENVLQGIQDIQSQVEA